MERLTIVVGRPKKFITPTNFFSVSSTSRLFYGYRRRNLSACEILTSKLPLGCEEKPKGPVICGGYFSVDVKH